jgi:hypothetical protein
MEGNSLVVSPAVAAFDSGVQSVVYRSTHSIITSSSSSIEKYTSNAGRFPNGLVTAYRTRNQSV